MNCNVVQVGKRRDGGYRYWCLAHRADATAKYGVAAARCVGADDEVIPSASTRDLDLNTFPGGVALWGAVPPAYDTTTKPLDRGIHVHARLKPGRDKFIDETYRSLSVQGPPSLFSDGWVELNELDAINYMVTRVFGFVPIAVYCSLCGFPHLDRDWFAVHPHRRHLCHGCGRHFTDSQYGIGNPLCAIRDHLQVKPRASVPAPRAVSISQADYPGGIQLWGSNSAIVWTGAFDEREGIHLHAFKAEGDKDPAIDGTFAGVEINDIQLDPLAVRYFMAQQALPHIAGRVVALTCPECGSPHLDVGEHAYTPHLDHLCGQCGATFRSPTRVKNVVGNPFVATRQTLALHAVRPVRVDKLGLRPEQP